MLEPWVYSYLNARRSIKNYTLVELQDIFEGESVRLQDYELLLLGYTSGTNMKSYAKIRVEGSTTRCLALRGAHDLTVFSSDGTSMKRMWVSSLTCFRRQHLKFTDRLSFERSAFIKINAANGGPNDP